MNKEDRDREKELKLLIHYKNEIIKQAKKDLIEYRNELNLLGNNNKTLKKKKK